MPGYCVAGTVGAKVLAGQKEIEIDRFTTVNVNMQIKNLSFSAHADAKGIMALIAMAKAKNVMLVHGEKIKMAKLKVRIQEEMGIPCYDPANGETITIYPTPAVPLFIPEQHIHELYKSSLVGAPVGPSIGFPMQGCVVLDDGKKSLGHRLKLLTPQESKNRYEPSPNVDDDVRLHLQVKQPFNPLYIYPRLAELDWQTLVLKAALEKINKISAQGENPAVLKDTVIHIGSGIKVSVTDDCAFRVRWNLKAADQALDILGELERISFDSIGKESFISSGIWEVGQQKVAQELSVVPGLLEVPLQDKHHPVAVAANSPAPEQAAQIAMTECYPSVPKEQLE
jgi:Zn-dependent metallo-hydrolase RNA specificity domain